MQEKASEMHASTSKDELAQEDITEPEDDFDVKELLNCPLAGNNYERIMTSLSNHTTMAEQLSTVGDLQAASNVFVETTLIIDKLFENIFENDDDDTNHEEKRISMINLDKRCSFLSAQTLMKLERFDNALEQWNVVLGHDSKDFTALFEAGRCLANLNHFGPALRKLKKALELDEQHKEVLDTMLIVKDHISYHHNIVKSCSDAIKLQKGYFQPYFERGKSNYFLGRYHLALEDLKKAQKMNPRNEEIEDLICEVEDALDEAIIEFENEEAQAKEVAVDKNDQSGIEKNKKTTTQEPLPSTSKATKRPVYEEEDPKKVVYQIKEKFPNTQWLMIDQRVRTIRKQSPDKSDEEIFNEISEAIESWQRNVEACEQMTNKIHLDFQDFCYQEVSHWVHHFKGENKKISAPSQEIIDQAISKLKEVQKTLVSIAEDDEMLRKVVDHVSRHLTDRTKFPLAKICFETKRTLNYFRRSYPDQSEKVLFYTVDSIVRRNVSSTIPECEEIHSEPEPINPPVKPKRPPPRSSDKELGTEEELNLMNAGEEKEKQMKIRKQLYEHVKHIYPNPAMEYMVTRAIHNEYVYNWKSIKHMPLDLALETMKPFVQYSLRKHFWRHHEDEEDDGKLEKEYKEKEKVLWDYMSPRSKKSLVEACKQNGWKSRNPYDEDQE